MITFPTGRRPGSFLLKPDLFLRMQSSAGCAAYAALEPQSGILIPRFVQAGGSSHRWGYEYRRTASTAFNPPNANEFDSATSTGIFRASFGT
jgi:hypothetical protein